MRLGPFDEGAWFTKARKVRAFHFIQKAEDRIESNFEKPINLRVEIGLHLARPIVY